MAGAAGSSSRHTLLFARLQHSAWTPLYVVTRPPTTSPPTYGLARCDYHGAKGWREEMCGLGLHGCGRVFVWNSAGWGVVGRVVGVVSGGESCWGEAELGVVVWGEERG